MRFVKEEDIERIKKGDLHPLGDVYDAVYPDCINFMKRTFNCSTDDAHDAVMDAFVVLVHKIKQDAYVNENLKSFLFKVSKNLWLNKSKRDRRLVDWDPKVLETLLIDTGENQDAEDEKELLGQAISAIKSMPKRCNSILSLTLIDGLSLDAVTEILKYKSKEVLKSMKSRCMKNLIKILKM